MWFKLGWAMKKAIISLIFLLSFAVPAFAASTADLRADAPDRYTVVPGDTLWGIATRFLKDPWRWPELWKMNRAQVRNPHRIYPGDVIVLERAGTQVQLRLETTNLAPRIRLEARDAEPIQTIAPSVIEPFLSKPLVVTATELNSAPEIVATQEDRVALGAGGIAYVKGLSQSQETRWQIFRRGDPLIDPETKEPLGYVGVYLGEAALARRGEPSTISITRATQEILRGDRLLPVPKENPIFYYVPRAPERPVSGRVIATYAGLSETGPLAIIVLSRGSRDGLEVGNVLALHRDARSARYASRTQALFGRQGPSGNNTPIPYYSPPSPSRDSPLIDRGTPIREADFSQLPAERYGLVMIFRAFDRASYGLVMQASRPVSVEDVVTNP